MQRAIEILPFHPIGVDIEIPLRAAERWLAGQEPYLMAAFDALPGRDLPFLYAPYVLPVVAPLTSLPVGLVIAAFVVAAAAVAAWTVHRLGVAWRFVPLVLVWTPFAEAIVGTNVEPLGFAALVALTAPGAPDLRARPVWIASLLTAATFVFKVAQLQVLAHALARAPWAAAGAIGGVAVLGLITLPLVGIDLWWTWLENGVRAGDPAWPLIGAPLSTIAGRPIALVATVLSILVATRIKGSHTAAWLGTSIIVGAPTLHVFGFVYLLPSLVLLRRDLALAIAAMAATAVLEPMWLAVAFGRGAPAGRSTLAGPPQGQRPIGHSYRADRAIPGATLHRPCESLLCSTVSPSPSAWS